VSYTRHLLIAKCKKEGYFNASNVPEPLQVSYKC
jgi:hypothetical protein